MQFSRNYRKRLYIRSRNRKEKKKGYAKKEWQVERKRALLEKKQQIHGYPYDMAGMACGPGMALGNDIPIITDQIKEIKRNKISPNFICLSCHTAFYNKNYQIDYNCRACKNKICYQDFTILKILKVILLVDS